MKSEKGFFTILFILVIVSMTLMLFLGLHKNVSSFMDMEGKEKQLSSFLKIKQIVSQSLWHYSACSKTFPSTETDITSIKNRSGGEVFKLDVDSAQSFYRDSGFYEKTGFRLRKIKILERNPKSFDSNKFQVHRSCESPRNQKPMASHEEDSVEHSVATLKLFFKREEEEKCFYLPISIQKKSGSLKTCSTSPEALSKFVCGKQSVKVACCRYVYNLTLDPEEDKEGKEFFEKGKKFYQVSNKVHTVTANPDLSEVVEIFNSSEDKGKNPKEGAREECETDAYLGKVKGRCTFKYNWVLTTECVYEE